MYKYLYVWCNLNNNTYYYKLLNHFNNDYFVGYVNQYNHKLLIIDKIIIEKNNIISISYLKTKAIRNIISFLEKKL